MTTTKSYKEQKQVKDFKKKKSDLNIETKEEIENWKKI